MRLRLLGILTLVLLLNTGYIAAFNTPSLFYMANVVLHLALGLMLTFGAFRTVRRFPTVPLAASALIGLAIVATGNTRDFRWLLILHIAAGVAAVGALLYWSIRSRERAFQRAVLAGSMAALALPVGMTVARRLAPDPRDRITNPLLVPTSMQEEGAGPKSPFWPSSSDTNTGQTIPSNFFMDSTLCAECHKDIYDQWNSSAHHFASFNNQFYRKSIEYMQDVAGTQPTKWCAACHDHAVFFNGRFEKPIKDQIDTPEAQNGLGCLSCHAMVHIDSTMGNSGFIIEYPKLHELASSHNPLIRRVDRFLTYLNPGPHRSVMMKPFMQSNSEFCSTCHKVHLDAPVNNYRWLRGFNDYDNWQASGVSGQGARSFYYPAKSQVCADCHMPLVASKDAGARDGKVHSHRFIAANSALPFVNHDQTQLSETEKFLKSGFITVDIFAASPVDETKGQTEMRRRSPEGPQLMSTFAVGEEAEQTGAVLIRDIGKVAAPIDTSGARFAPGTTVRIDTVVRTRKIGHFFPGGTVDAFDVWLELIAKDASGKTIFWSGKVEDGGLGPVERGAHFYRSYQLDADGNMINKRNAFQSRSVLYVRLIPPGAADVAHFRLNIPKDAKGPISVQAKLNYRKFAHYYTQFAYAGKPKPGSPELVNVNFDSREFSFDKANIPANVSGKIKGEIPNLPIITIAQSSAKLELGVPTWEPTAQKRDRERWNDWGIGLLLQGDLKGAEYAFKKVTEAEPEYADGWLNVARALIQEGETDAAKPYLERALSINNKLGRIHFFKALAQKADGDYDGALESLRTVAAQYPRDRVVQNQIGRVLFLKRDYAGAEKALLSALSVDPEDLQAHYTLMLVYRGMGQPEKAKREETLFRRFKADESSQAITAKARMVSPEDNNERQMIHDHESTPLGTRQ
ncbi:MAG: tetratricopeptide repeat protein [Acidobacteria bacterium]|nr:tetratricopeptide repeat protein [Acidobacteriota bacterium]